MKASSGHLSYLTIDTTCPKCKAPVTCQLGATPLKEFPKRIKFACKHLACNKEWWKVVGFNLEPIEYELPKSRWQRLVEFFFGRPRA